jgi:NADH-quinone oxidoreductase subunit I
MSLMEITIDREKCKVPAACGKCLAICPQAVFKLHLATIEKFKEAQDEDWHLDAWYWTKCSGCMECVKICPLDAIRVKVRKTGKNPAPASIENIT